MAAGGVICTNCGFNLQTGQRIVTSVSQVEKAAATSEAEKMVAKAAEEIAHMPISADAQDFGDGSSPWAYVLALFLPLLLAFAVFAVFSWGNYLAAFFAFMLLGITKGDFVIIFLASTSIIVTIATMMSWFKIAFIALEEHALFGIGCILLCFFVPIYGIMRWKKCAFWTITYLVGVVVTVVLLIPQILLFGLFYAAEQGGGG